MTGKAPRVGVACIVTRGDRTLLVRRQRSHGTGTWSTPGGHLDFGETPAACAMRETEEETGVRVATVEFVAITNDVFDAEGKHYITVWMRADASEGEAVVRDETEIAEVGWFAPDALPAPLFLSLENLLGGAASPPESVSSVEQPNPGSAPAAFVIRITTNCTEHRLARRPSSGGMSTATTCCRVLAGSYSGLAG